MHRRQSVVGVSDECLQQVRSRRDTTTSCCCWLLLIVDDPSRPLPAAADINTDADSASPSTSWCSTGRWLPPMAVLRPFWHAVTADTDSHRLMSDTFRPDATRGAAGDRCGALWERRYTCFIKIDKVWFTYGWNTSPARSAV